MTSRYDLNTFIVLCESAGVPITHGKTADPVQILEFLDITIDVLDLCPQLPNDKVEWCQALLKDASASNIIMLLYLRQLVGHLDFAYQIVVTGHPFQAALCVIMKKISKPYHKARLCIGKAGPGNIVFLSLILLKPIILNKISPKTTSCNSILALLHFMDMALASKKSGSTGAGQRIGRPRISWCRRLTQSWQQL